MRRLALSSLPALALVFAACADDGGGEDEIGDPDATTTADTSTDGNTEIGTDGETTANPETTGETDTTTSDGTSDDTTTTTSEGTDTSDGTDTGTDTGNEDYVLRFIAMGDGGEGNDGQYNVAAAIEQVCGLKGGCEFVLYLGDNFYDDGVSSAMDDQFQTKFEMPYADLDMPFHIVLGNHDYGELSFIWEKSAYEIEYSNYSDKWELPSEWYSVSYPNLDVFVLDTTRFMWDHDTNDQQSWINSAIAGSDAPWKIAVGHHPYYSNGAHGNAGEYEGLPPLLPQVSGTVVQDVMDESICGKVDLYLCGHDHNRQWLVPTCGDANLQTQFVVSGAAAKTTDFEYHDGGNEVYWENDTVPGFMYLELTVDSIHTEFYDQNGAFNFERDIVK